MPSHQEAYNIIRDEWPAVHGRLATNNEILFTQAVAWLETNYGRAGQHGKLAEQGMYNWANEEKQAQPGKDPPEGWAAGKDSAQNVWFKVWPSDHEAARRLIGLLTKGRWKTIPPANDPATAEAFVAAMKHPPDGDRYAYFSGPEQGYIAGINNALALIASKTGKTIDPPGQQTQVLDTGAVGTKTESKIGNVAASVGVGGGIVALVYAALKWWFK